MPATHVSVYVHIIFSTKSRHPFLRDDLLPRVHDYLGGSVRGLGAVSLGVGGVGDHVHLLISLKTTHRIADVVRELKKASTAWMRETMHVRDFAWQEGYAVFSVSFERLVGVQKYIARQAEHHRTVSGEEELVQLLRFSGVE